MRLGYILELVPKTSNLAYELELGAVDGADDVTARTTESLEMVPNLSNTEIRIMAARHARVNTDLETQINVRQGPVPSFGNRLNSGTARRIGSRFTGVEAVMEQILSRARD